ncbi:MAG: hypothetical protein AB7Q29_13540 [Vicinamibacterales bacterium]
MLIGYKRGQGSVILRVKILDSAVATGAGKTGLAYNTAGLIIGTIADNESATTRYRASSSEVEDITTLGTFAAPTSGKCRFKEVDATNHKGVYEIQLADARFSVSSAKSLLVSIGGASGGADCDVVVPLRDLDPFDAAAGGLSRLDAAVSSRLADSAKPANFSSLAITAAGKVTVGTNDDKTGYDLVDAPNATAITAIVTAVWSAGTRTVTSFGSLVSDIWAAVADSAGVTTLLERLTALRASNLDALDASVSGAVSNASAAATAASASATFAEAAAVAAVAVEERLPDAPAAVGSAMTLTSGERAAVADAYLDRSDAVETGVTPRKLWQRLAAFVGGAQSKSAGRRVFKAMGNTSQTRIDGAEDDDGNRSDVSFDGE